MAEERETTAEIQPGVAAWSALGASSRERADEFLAEQIRLTKEQTELARLQADDLRREDALRHWSLRVHHISDVLKLAFELALATIFTAIVVGITYTAWSAAHEDGLVIEAFSVPPDMAVQGLTGQAIAAKLQDKLAAMQAVTDSARPAESFSNNWGNDIKVEIPDTGVSIGEFYRYLVMRLGHQSHITGEVYRSGGKIAVTVRSGGDGSETVTGADSDIDTLMQKAAEQIYLHTQPYRYAVYLGLDAGRLPESMAIFQRLANEGSRQDRVWAYIGIGTLEDFSNPQGEAFEARAIPLDPDFVLPWANLEGHDLVLGHDEQVLADEREAVRLLDKGNNGTMNARAWTIMLPSNEAVLAASLGDFAASLDAARQTLDLPDYSGIAEGSKELILSDLAQLHEAPAMLRMWSELSPPNDPPTQSLRALSKISADYWAHDWASLVGERIWAERAVRSVAAMPQFGAVTADVNVVRQLRPYIAVALAHQGDFNGAHALIDTTPRDCYFCIRARGEIDAAERNWIGAGYWFARAAAMAPSIPQSWSHWGEMLLAKGDLDGAIAKFAIAHEKGPNYADPLEMWGEALILKNRSDLAVAKFDEAAKDAPNWGRLHLKWGEALLWSGDKDGARKQFAMAATLELSASDKAALAGLRAEHG